MSSEAGAGICRHFRCQSTDVVLVWVKDFMSGDHFAWEMCREHLPESLREAYQ